MAVKHIIRIATIVILSMVLGSFADPGHDHHHHHTKHIVHAPLHIKVIHHHKIIKVPVVFRKHYHHHKHLSHENVYIPLKEKPKAVYEEYDGGDGDSSGPPAHFISVHGGGSDDEEQGSPDHEGLRHHTRISEELHKGDHDSSYEYDELPGNIRYRYH